MKNFLLKGIGKNVVQNSRQVLPSHPPATQEPQPVWKDAAHRKRIEHRYKRLIASYLNSVLVSPYQLSLSLQDAFGNSKKEVPASCEFTF